jgi:hypothetical protein
MNDDIFENFFGEKPHEQVAKRIANVALNSYDKFYRIGFWINRKRKTALKSQKNCGLGAVFCIR